MKVAFEYFSAIIEICSDLLEFLEGLRTIKKQYDLN